MDTEDVSFNTAHSEIDCEHSNNSSYVMAQRYVENAKERNRNKNVNMAFSTLRTLIPTEPKDRKLSKIETLRLATSYILHLANVIRARTEGYFGVQVCERYGYLLTDEMNLAANQKHICTFCLTDSRRNYLNDNKDVAAINSLGMQNSLLFVKEPQEKIKQLLSLHNHFQEDSEDECHQNRQHIIKKEI